MRSKLFAAAFFIAFFTAALCSPIVVVAQAPGVPRTVTIGEGGGGGSQQPLGPKCKAIKYSGVLTGHVNIVFVPSAFNNDMALFAEKVAWIYSIFNSYEPFQDSIARLNVLYVTDDAGSYCTQPCNGMDRFLCCELPKAVALSANCTSGPRQTVVVHNSTTYGGAGYWSSDVATTTINEYAPRVAIHELGHSLFSLGDEYNYAGSTPAGSPNCDVARCPKWDEMIGYNGIDCRVGFCGGNQYYVAENTIMQDLAYRFEEVNLRISCCTYFRETGMWPSYCTQFNRFSAGSDLNDFCKVSPIAGAGAAPEYLEEPEELLFAPSISDGGWALTGRSRLPSGFYKQERIRGQGQGAIKIELSHAAGKKKLLAFETEIPVEFPGEGSKMAGYARRPRELISVVVDRKKDGELSSINVLP